MSKTIYYSRELGRILTEKETKPIAQFRVKGGCKTCKPIPVMPRPANLLEPVSPQH